MHKSIFRAATLSLGVILIVHEVCIGTNQKDDMQYYLDRPRVASDPHGQAPILWCAWALLGK